MAKLIPYAHQDISREDIEEVCQVLRSDFLTTGPAIPAFEDALCAVTGAQYACACSSATAALHLTLAALGIGPDDYIMVSSISFVSSANCARFVGAGVRFIDGDEYGCISTEHLKQELERCVQQGEKLPAAVVAVDLGGHPCALDKLRELKEQYHFYLIEDAAHSLGALYQGHRIGDGAFADAVIFSFHPVKIITTAEGGAVLTNNAALHQKACLLRSHGIVHDTDSLQQKDRPGYYYEMQTLGWNYRISDLQAALGLSQLERLDAFLTKRRELAACWQELLAPYQDLGLITLPRADEEQTKASWHLYQIQVKHQLRDELYRRLRQKQIGVQVHYLPIYSQPYYREIIGEIHLAGADAFGAETLSLPLYPGLTTLQWSFVTAQVCSTLDELWGELKLDPQVSKQTGKDFHVLQTKRDLLRKFDKNN